MNPYIGAITVNEYVYFYWNYSREVAYFKPSPVRILKKKTVKKFKNSNKYWKEELLGGYIKIEQKNYQNLICAYTNDELCLPLLIEKYLYKYMDR